MKPICFFFVSLHCQRWGQTYWSSQWQDLWFRRLLTLWLTLESSKFRPQVMRSRSRCLRIETILPIYPCGVWVFVIYAWASACFSFLTGERARAWALGRAKMYDFPRFFHITSYKTFNSLFLSFFNSLLIVVSLQFSKNAICVRL